MFPPKGAAPITRIRVFFRGLGEVGAFVWECTVAVFEICIGRWPQPEGARRRRPKAPNEGMGPVEKIAPFPTQE